MKMKSSMCLAILIYINLFYFGCYALFELVVLLVKAVSLPETRYAVTHFIYELFVLACFIVLEYFRLQLASKHQPADLDRKMSEVFRIVVLTVPSMYSVAYFTFWQNFVSRLDLCFGVVMLIIQAAQCLSAILTLMANFCTQHRSQLRHLLSR